MACHKLIPLHVRLYCTSFKSTIQTVFSQTSTDDAKVSQNRVKYPLTKSWPWTLTASCCLSVFHFDSTASALISQAPVNVVISWIFIVPRIAKTMSDSVYVENITLPLSMFSKDCDFIAIDKGKDKGWVLWSQKMLMFLIFIILFITYQIFIRVSCSCSLLKKNLASSCCPIWLPW